MLGSETTVTDRVHYHPNLIFSVGTQGVTLVDIPGAAGLVMHPRGAVGVVVKSPTDLEHSYRVRFPDGFETPLERSEVTMLARFKEGELGDSDTGQLAQTDLYQRVIYRWVIGSQAYGLAEAESDVDRRGIYLPTADLDWSLCDPALKARYDLALASAMLSPKDRDGFSLAGWCSDPRSDNFVYGKC